MTIVQLLMSEVVLGASLVTTALVVLAIASVATVVLIVVAPWKQVREEPPLDPAAEAKLLLHQDPDEPTGEYGAVTPIDGTDPEPDQLDLADLKDLDELGTEQADDRPS